MGGTVRDLLRGRRPLDIDIATEGDPVEVARGFADATGGSFFHLSDAFRTCRVVAAGGRVTYDFARLRGATIEDDLGGRDFTVNAMAVALPGGGIIDPLNGAAHLKEKKLIAVSASIFDDDPLRLLRAVRLEKTLGLAITGELAPLIRARAALVNRPAAERVFAELAQVLEPPGAADALRRLDGLELLGAILPEIAALKGVEQNEYHHLDVYNHILATIDELEALMDDPGRVFPGAAAKIEERLGQRVAGDAGCRLVLVLAALMHDIAKPVCLSRDENGGIRFLEHDCRGAEMAKALLARFHASTGATQAVSLLVAQHLRLGFLVHEQPPSNRARLRYIKATGPYTAAAIILSVSDRLAVRGPKSTAAAIERHLSLAREMMDLCFAEEEAEPLPKLVRGDELISELDLKPGPLVGRLLEHIHEEQKLGNISTREEALAAAASAAKRRREGD